MYPLPGEIIFNFHLKNNNYNPILLYVYEIKHLVAILYLKKNLVNSTDSEHLYTVDFNNLFII